jgi:Effector Associated Constant Component 1
VAGCGQLGDERQAAMDAQIRIAGGAYGELAALSEWLQGENELRGRIRTVHGAIGETELGPTMELLTVALGAGGAGTVLASSLRTWLLTRKTTAKIVVKSGGRSVTLDIQTVDEVGPLLEQVLKANDDE